MTELTARSMVDSVGVAAVPVVVARLPASCVVVGLVVVLAGRASETREVPAFEVAISMCEAARDSEVRNSSPYRDRMVSYPQTNTSARSSTLYII